MLSRYTPTLLLLLGFATSLAAQEPGDTIQAVETIRVTARRSPQAAGGASLLYLPVDSLRMPPAAPFEAVLRATPFVLTRQNSRGEAEISIRGSDSRQVAVLLDGLPLTLGWDGRTDPSLIPVTGIHSVAIIRGLSSLLHGPNVLGGIAELGLSADPSLVRSRSATLTLGADATGALGMTASGVVPSRLGSGMLAVSAGLGYRTRDGFASAEGVTEPGSDPDLRTNSDLQEFNGFATARWQAASGLWVGIGGLGYEAERGVPPELHVSQPRLWRYPHASRVLGVMTAGSGRRDTPWGRGSVRASVGFNRGSTETDQFSDFTYSDVVGTEEGTERTFTSRLIADHSLGSSGTLRAAATWADIRYDERLDSDPESHYRQRIWSVGAESEWVVGTVTRVSGGLAWDGADTPETGGKPPLAELSDWGGRFGVTSVLGASRVHASLSRRARFPSLRELYSEALGRFAANPDLGPETLVGGEAGITAFPGNFELSGVAFHNNLRDAVVRVATDDGRFRRENRNSIRTTGLELLGAWRPGDLAFMTDLVLQNVVLSDEVANEVTHAENQPEIRGRAEASIPAWGGTIVRPVAVYTSIQYCVNPDTGREDTVDASLRADLAVERSWGIGGGLFRYLRAIAAVDNLADDAVYDQCGLPQPGRTFRVGIELR